MYPESRCLTCGAGVGVEAGAAQQLVVVVPVDGGDGGHGPGPRGQLHAGWTLPRRPLLQHVQDLLVQGGLF